MEIDCNNYAWKNLVKVTFFFSVFVYDIDNDTWETFLNKIIEYKHG